MNELAVREDNKTVTTKELASVLGVEPRTIQLAVQKLGLANVLSQVKIRGPNSFVFTEEQATLIKQHIQEHHNLANRKIDTVTTEAEENQMIAQAFYILQRRIDDANKEIAKLKPAAEFAYQICSSKDAIDIGNCAKVLNRNIGRNTLFEFLRNKLNGAVILISHQERILSIADNIVVIDSGRVKAAGLRDEMLPTLTGATVACKGMSSQEAV